MTMLLAIGAFFRAIPSWAYKWIAIGVAILALIIYVDRKATYRERAVCEQKAQAAVEAAKRQDVSAQKVTTDDEGAVVAELNTIKGENARLLKDLDNAKSKAATATKAAASCGYTRDDLDRYDRVR